VIIFVGIIVACILFILISSYARYANYQKLIEQQQREREDEERRNRVWRQRQLESVRREEQQERVRQEQQEQIEQEYKQQQQRLAQQEFEAMEHKLQNISEALARKQHELETLQEQELARQQHEQDVSFYMNVSWIPEELSGPVHAFLAPWKSGSGHITVRFLRTDEDIYYVVIENWLGKLLQSRRLIGNESRRPRATV